MHTYLRIALLCTWALSPAAAADFGFNVLIRAGLNTTGEWEVGMGLNSSGVPTGTPGQMSPYYADGAPQRFEIGYDAGTSQAYTRIYSGSALAVSVLYTVPGAFALSPSGTWTLPASSFYTSAAVRPAATSVSVSSMALTTAAGVLNPLTITASNNGTTGQLTTLPASVVFQAQSGGSWMLSGQLTMSGLSAYTANGAQRSQLQFGLTATASETPEPASVVLLGSALDRKSVV